MAHEGRVRGQAGDDNTGDDNYDDDDDDDMTMTGGFDDNTASGRT